MNENGGVRKKYPESELCRKRLFDRPYDFEHRIDHAELFSYPAVTEHQEDGKTVFATWSGVKPGASAKLSFEYTHHAFTPPAPGVVYQFVFEKQAGTDRNYSFEVDAPLGYQFAETDLPSWTYSQAISPAA